MLQYSKKERSGIEMKKITAIILSLAMLFCSLSVVAFAQDEKPFYLVLGDSIAYGSGLANSKAACYGKIVADTNGYEYVNHSVPSHTTANLISRLSNETVIADLEKADIISISIGGNDFLLNNLIGLMFDSIVKNDHTQYDAIADNVYVNLGKIVDIINENNEDAVILMQTLYNPQSGYLRAPYQAGADRINAAIARYNEENPGEIVIVDVGTALGDDLENFASDEIHPSTKGNEIIAKEVLAKLYELELGESTEPVIAEKGVDIQVPAIMTMMLDVYGYFFHVLSLVYDFFASVF